MYWCASLLVAAAVISGNVLADTATEHELLKKEVLAKGMVLQTYSSYMQDVLLQKRKKNDDDEKEEVIGFKVQAPRNQKEMIAAVYERYSALRLMINYLGCRLFYKEECCHRQGWNVNFQTTYVDDIPPNKAQTALYPGAAKPEAGDYEGCLQYSHYLNWYNGNLNIGRIYDLYLNTLSRKTTAPDLHLHAVVEKLKLLFQLQNQMYDVFEEASKQNQYSILFEKLVAVADQRLNAADGEPIKKDTNLKVGEVEDAFRQETLTRLYKFYGQAIIDVENYWNRFFFNAVERPEIQDFAELVKDGSTEEERQRSFYKVMEESEFEPTKLTFENVDAIHYAEVLYYGLEMRVKNVPEVLPEREWEAIPTPNDPDIDFKLKFLELDPTEQAADIGASSSRAESSSRNV